MPGATNRATAVVLAAGASTRMGCIKQLAVLDGRPLLAHVLLTASATADIDGVVVVLGAHAAEISAALKLDGPRTVVAPDWVGGTAATLHAGLQAVAPGDDAVVLLGDQPFVAAESISRVLERARASGRLARATYGSRPGHPLAILAAQVDRLSSSREPRAGDARRLLAGAPIEPVPCDDLRGGEDVDDPERLERLARGSGSSLLATASQLN